MSALDQAYIRAYARGPAPQQQVAASREPAPMPLVSSGPSAANGAQVESLYAAGSLYRLDWTDADSASVPSPHVPLDAQRRQLRFARRAAASVPPPPPAVAPRRPASTFRQPLNLVAAKLTQFTPEPLSVLIEADELTLAPVEPVAASPAAAAIPPVAVPVFEPPVAPAPPAPPRLEAFTAQQIQISTSSWQLPTSPPAMMVTPLDESRLARGLTAALVSLQFDSYTQPPASPVEVVTELKVTKEESKPAPVADVPEEPSFRLDPPVSSIPKPHFGKKATEPKAEPVEAPRVAAPPAITEELPPQPAEQQAAAPQPCVPVWEVDCFQWPAVCERLLFGEKSYFAQSGEKLQSAVRDGLRVLGVAGTKRGDGSTTLALCLAKSAALAGLSVAVVDADFTRPELAECLGLEVECGWQAAAMGKAPLAEAAIKSLEDGLTVFPIKPEEKPTLTLADARSGELLRTISASFDLVIVDLGPATAGSGPILPLSSPCPIDAAVVVRDARSVTESSARIVGLRLHAAGIEAVGLAENFGDFHS